ncbi:hypothetical protein B0H14DRAFT_2581130 [Mycena olivaceomarginata]|nr:hypothetical protein B0H14DRAFT_2581130 [Mycena olivaceomarginata]
MGRDLVHTVNRVPLQPGSGMTAGGCQCRKSDRKPHHRSMLRWYSGDIHAAIPHEMPRRAHDQALTFEPVHLEHYLGYITPYSVKDSAQHRTVTFAQPSPHLYPDEDYSGTAPYAVQGYFRGRCSNAGFGICSGRKQKFHRMLKSPEMKIEQHEAVASKTASGKASGLCQ